MSLAESTGSQLAKAHEAAHCAALKTSATMSNAARWKGLLMI
jgi:hypothetical protein